MKSRTLAGVATLILLAGCMNAKPPANQPAGQAPPPPAPQVAAPKATPEPAITPAARNGEADTAPEFAGVYESEDGSKNSEIKTVNGGCLIKHIEGDATVSAPGLVLGHYLGSCYAKTGNPRFSAYVVDGSGKLAGRTAAGTDGDLQVSDEVLEGPVFPKEEEEFAKYEGGKYSGGGVEVTITKTGENSLTLTRSDGSKGFGFRMDKWLWVGWDGALCVYQFPDNSLTDLQVNFLAEAGAEPAAWPLMKLKKGEEAAALQAKIEGEAPPVAAAEPPPEPGQPFDAPPDPPREKPDAQEHHEGGVDIPPKGPQVSYEVAKAQLKQDMPKKIEEFLKMHNQARAAVGVPPIQWDPKIAAYAQEWADHLAAQGHDLHHRGEGRKYGENLAGYLPEYGERPVHGVALWYDEVKDYDGGKMEGKNFDAGHYTQMIWRNSSKVGFGIAICKNGMAILCANYDEHGNMAGEHPYKPDN